MDKQTNIWAYVIIALIVGILIGYVAASRVSAGGQAISKGLIKSRCGAGSQEVCTATGKCFCVADSSIPQTDLGGCSPPCSSTQTCMFGVCWNVGRSAS